MLLNIVWCVIKEALQFNPHSFHALKRMTFQEKGPVLFLEVVVLFGFLLSVTAVSQLTGAILRLYNSACSAVFLYFGCASHSCSTTIGRGNAPHTSEMGDHGCILSPSTHRPQWGGTARDQEPLHDQLKNKLHDVHLLQPIIYCGQNWKWDNESH